MRLGHIGQFNKKAILTQNAENFHGLGTLLNQQNN